MKIGIDLGGSHIAIGLVDDGIIINKKEHNFTKEEKESINSTIEKFLNNALDEITKEIGLSNIEMVGISVPGRIKNGYIQNAPNLKVNNLNIENIVKEKIDVPVYSKNDGMCAGIAEKEYGNLKDCINGVFLGFGTGVGTAVFINGKLEESIRSARTYDNTKRW
jgi:predicted NBD/HSP70 family sugar kinase